MNCVVCLLDCGELKRRDRCRTLRSEETVSECLNLLFAPLAYLKSVLPRFIRFQIRRSLMFDSLCYSSCFTIEINMEWNTVLEMVLLFIVRMFL